MNYYLKVVVISIYNLIYNKKIDSNNKKSLQDFLYYHIFYYFEIENFNNNKKIDLKSLVLIY